MTKIQGYDNLGSISSLRCCFYNFLLAIIGLNMELENMEEVKGKQGYNMWLNAGVSLSVKDMERCHS